MDPIAIGLMILFVGFSFLGIYYFFIRSYRNALAKQKKGFEELDRQSAFPPPLDEMRATLVKKKCGTKMVGTKYPECQREFVLVFEDEYEREIPLSVDEEIYLAIEEGDSGILALSDGKLYSFALDE